MMCFDFYLCVTSEGLVSIGAKFMFFLVASPFSWSLWKNLFLDIYAGHVILYWETLFCLDWSQPLVLLPLLFMVLSHSFASAGFYFFKYLPTYQLPSIFISSFVPNLIEYYNEHHFQFVDFFFRGPTVVGRKVVRDILWHLIFSHYCCGLGPCSYAGSFVSGSTSIPPLKS